jgi:hypothetical protein
MPLPYLSKSAGNLLFPADMFFMYVFIYTIPILHNHVFTFPARSRPRLPLMAKLAARRSLAELCYICRNILQATHAVSAEGL